MEILKKDSEFPQLIRNATSANKDVNWEIVGKRILERRIKLNKSQEELADSLNTTKQNISKYENGAKKSTKPETLAMIPKFAHALQCSIEYIRGLVDSPNQILIANGILLFPESFPFLSEEKLAELQKIYNDRQFLKLKKFRRLKDHIVKKFERKNNATFEHLSKPTVFFQIDKNKNAVTYDPLYPERGCQYVPYFPMDVEYDEIYVGGPNAALQVLFNNVLSKSNDHKLMEFFLENYHKLDTEYMRACIKINTNLPSKNIDAFNRLKVSLNKVLKNSSC